MSDLHTLETPGSEPRKTPHKGRSGKTSDRKPSKDWTIKGLPTETVEVARDAARESGMKINAWVAQVFSQAASAPRLQGEIMSRDRTQLEMDLAEEIERLRMQNEELTQTVNNLSAAIAKMCK